MAWRPAIPPEEYGKYFTIPELCIIFATRKERLNKMVKELKDDPNKIIRIYWRPKAYALTHPEFMLHLDDVWKFGKEFGIEIPREWITEVLIIKGWHKRRWPEVAGVVGGGYGNFMNLERPE
jgi:hypothetical protein